MDLTLDERPVEKLRETTKTRDIIRLTDKAGECRVLALPSWWNWEMTKQDELDLDSCLDDYVGIGWDDMWVLWEYHYDSPNEVVEVDVSVCFDRDDELEF